MADNTNLEIDLKVKLDAAVASKNLQTLQKTSKDLVKNQPKVIIFS